MLRRILKAFVFSVGVMLALVTFPAFAQAVLASSTFDTDADGWIAANDFTNFEYVASGGNPDGYIRATDLALGDVWRFVAPPKFRGNKSAAYGGTLAYDVRLEEAGGPFFEGAEVILRNLSAGLTLVYNTSNQPALGTWTHFVAPLNEAGWTVEDSAGPAATKDQMLIVLGNLERLIIRGEYITGPDREGLDNVIMTAPGVVPPISSFPSPGRLFLDVASFVENNQGQMTPAERQAILAQMQVLQAQSSAYQPLSQFWKNRLNEGAYFLSFGNNVVSSTAQLVNLLDPLSSSLSKALSLAGATNTLTTYLPSNNQLLERARLGVSFLSNVQNAAIFGGVVGNPLSAALFSNVFIWGSMVPYEAKRLAVDPPTDEYLVPISVSIPNLVPVTRTGLESINLFFTRFNDVTARTLFHMQAVSATVDRYAAALEARHNVSALLQLRTFLNYLVLLRDDLRDAGAAFAQLPAMLELAGFTYPQGDPSDFQDVQADILATGLPNEVILFLLNNGILSSDISALAYDLGHFDLSTLTAGPGPIDVLAGMTRTLDDLAGPINPIPEPTLYAMMLEDFATMVKKRALPNGIENSLTSKLNAAASALQRGNQNAVSGKLSAFMNEVEAQRGKKIPMATADGFLQIAATLLGPGPTGSSSLLPFRLTP